jgi:hypothetical protein
MKQRPTYADLKSRVAELEEENQALNEKPDSILDIASNEEDEEEEDEDDEE